MKRTGRLQVIAAVWALAGCGSVFGAITLDASYSGGAGGSLTLLNQSDSATTLTITTPGGGPDITITCAQVMTVSAGSNVNVVGSGTTTVTVTILDGAVAGSFVYTGNGQDETIQFGDSGGTAAMACSNLGAACALVVNTGGGTDSVVIDYTTTASGTAGISITTDTVKVNGTTLADSDSLALSCSQLEIGDGSGAADSAVVQLSADSQVSSTAAVVIAADGKFDLNGRAQTVASLGMTAGNVVTGLGALTLHGNVTTTAGSGTASITGTVNLGGDTREFRVADDTNAIDLVIDGPIVGTGDVVKTNPGTMRLGGTASDTYTGTTIVADGTLLLYHTGGTTAIPGGLIVGDGVGAADSAIVKLLANNQTASTTPVMIVEDAKLDLNGFDDTISTLDMTSGSLATGTGTLTLGGNVTITAAGSTSAITGNVNLGGATRTFVVEDGVGAIDLSIDGVVTGTGGIIKADVGTMRLSGNTTSNSYTGSTVVQNGVLALFHTGATVAVPGALTIGDGTGAADSAVVQLLANGQTATTTAVALLVDGKLDLNGFNDTISTLDMTSGNVTTGSGTLTLGGNVTVNAAAGNAAITGNLDLGSATRTFTVADDASAIDLALDGVISGTGGVVKAGAGTMQMAGNTSANSYSGSTVVQEGTLALYHTGGTLAVPGSLTIGDASGAADSAIVQLLASDQTATTTAVALLVDGKLDLNSFDNTISTLSMTSGQITTGTGTLTLGGDVTVNSDTGNAAFTGNLDVGGATRTFTVANDASATDFALDGVILGTGGIVKAGTGTMQLAGSTSNSYSGSTVVHDGTLALNHASGTTAIPGGLTVGDGSGAANSAMVQFLASGQTATTTVVVLLADGKLDLNGFDDTISSLAMTGGTVATAAGTLTLDGNLAVSSGGGQATITGDLDLNAATRTFTVADDAAVVDLQVDATVGNGGLTKNGAGLLRLAGTNTYTGATTVNAGTLQVTGSIAGSTSTVSGGTLGGTGTVGGLTAGSGSVAPGLSPGALATGALSLGASSTLNIELGGTTAGTEYDQLAVTGSVTLGSATLSLSLGSYTPAYGSTYTIISNDGVDPVSGQFAQGSSLTAGGYTFTVDYAGGDGNDVVLRCGTANANLGGLAVSQGSLSPAFDPATTSYTVSVANSVTSLDLTATLADAGASMTINNAAQASGVAKSISLSAGANVVTIVVTSQNTVVQKTYTVTINRAPSTNADLAGLVINQGTLSPSFAAATTTYTASVNNAITSINLTATTADTGATMTVNGTAQASGTGKTITLSVGSNVVTIAVTAQDGSTQKTYTVTISRAQLPAMEAGLVRVPDTAGNQAYVSDNVDLLVSVNNTGTITAPGTTVRMEIPAGLTYVSAEAQSGIPTDLEVTLDGNTLLITVGDLAAGAEATIGITLQAIAASSPSLQAAVRTNASTTSVTLSPLLNLTIEETPEQPIDEGPPPLCGNLGWFGAVGSMIGLLALQSLGARRQPGRSR